MLDHERAFDLERLILLCLDIYVFLGLHKALESGQFERTRRSLEIEASVLREIFMRWVPGSRSNARWRCSTARMSRASRMWTVFARGPKMPSLTINTRQTKSGRRFIVRFRLGGRAYPIVHGGSFRTMREAKIRRDLIGGELAAGRNPADVLNALATTPTPSTTLAHWRHRFIESRIDVDENTKKNYVSALKKACETFGDRDPATITADEVATWVADLASSYKPGTIALYLLSLRMLFDFIGLEPNVARDPRVKKPKQVREEPVPPSADHLLAILTALGEKWRLLFVTIEQGALRLGEAVSLRWGDVDAANLRLRLPRSATKRDQARWVSLPEWLVEAMKRPARSRIALRSGVSSRESPRPRPTRR